MRPVYVLATFDNWRVSYHVATMDKDLAESLKRTEELLEETRNSLRYLSRENEKSLGCLWATLVAVLLAILACAYPVWWYALMRLAEMDKVPWPFVNNLKP